MSRSPSATLKKYSDRLTFTKSRAVVGSGATAVIYDATANTANTANTVSPNSELAVAIHTPLVIKELRKKTDDSESTIHSELTQGNEGSFELGIANLIAPGVMVKGDIVLASLLSRFIAQDLDDHCYSHFVITFLLSMCVALSTLENHHVVHMDIKPENILLRYFPDKGYAFYLIDFSSAKKYDNLSGPQSYTIPFVAPEILSGELPSQNQTALDIFSIGKILYLLLNPGVLFFWWRRDD